MTMNKDEEKPEFQSKCAVCGQALRNSEIGGTISGEFIDYTIEKGKGEIDADFCIEHWTALFTNCTGDIPTAIAKRRAAESYERETKEQFLSDMTDRAIKIEEIDAIIQELDND